MKKADPRKDVRYGRMYAAPRQVRVGLGRDAALCLLLNALSVACLSLIFPPYELWPLAFVCLVPWGVMVCRIERTWLVYWGGFAAGWVFFLINLSWLMPVTGLGYAALAFYLALYWPLATWAIRTGRRCGISLLWTLPVTWVACELLRAWVMTGFPWFFLSHALFRHVTFIQISDLTGAYGVSLIIALVNGVVVELVLGWWRAAGEKPGRRQLAAGALATVAILAGNHLYGKHQLGQADFRDGPRVAVVQEDFPLASEPPYGDLPWVVFTRYIALGAQAAQEQPDLLVFPETAWGGVQNIGFLEAEHRTVDEIPAGAYMFGQRCDRAISGLALGDYGPANGVIAEWEGYFKVRASKEPERGWPRALPRLPQAGGPPVTVVVGSLSVETFLDATYPKVKKYNSALIYDENGEQRLERYDKNHLVPFGEFVPFRYGRLHWLYRWLNKLSPFSYGGTLEYSLSPGAGLTVFDLDVDGETYRFGTPICYEDVMPCVIRRYVWEGSERRVDFLVNISNDGWFLRSAELPQHLAICVFRAVENRVGIARAVNTGISGFIDPNGQMYSLVELDGRTYGEGVIGYRVAPVKIDQRGSFYGRHGDWLAGLCLVLTTALWIGAVLTRWVAGLGRRLAAWRAKGGG